MSETQAPVKERKPTKAQRDILSHLHRMGRGIGLAQGESPSIGWVDQRNPDRPIWVIHQLISPVTFNILGRQGWITATGERTTGFYPKDVYRITEAGRRAIGVEP